MPFHALSNDGVSSVHEEDMSLSRSRVTSCKAHIDANLLTLLSQTEFRRQLRVLILSRYFPEEEQVGLAEALGMPFAGAPPRVEEETLHSIAARRLGRSALFRTEVILGYRFTCALTGYCLIDREQLSIVEAAHIHAFQESLDNDPANGLALTPTAHALFDRGLWSVDDSMRILGKPVSDFAEASPTGGFSLRALAGKSLHFDGDSRLRPATRHLAWHRRKHGF